MFEENNGPEELFFTQNTASFMKQQGKSKQYKINRLVGILKQLKRREGELSAENCRKSIVRT